MVKYPQNVAVITILNSGNKVDLLGPCSEFAAGTFVRCVGFS